MLINCCTSENMADDEYFTDCEDELKALQDKCKNMRPTLRSDVGKGKKSSVQQRPLTGKKIQANANKLPDDFLRPDINNSSNGNNNKVIPKDDLRLLIGTVQSDVNKHLESVSSKFTSVFSLINSLADRVEQLEYENKTQADKITKQSKQILQLENKADDRDRKLNSNFAILTYPKLNTASPTFRDDVFKFLTQDLKLPMYLGTLISVSTFGKSKNSFLLEMPTLEAKRQLYVLRKKLTEAGDANYGGLYISDLLTKKNLELLKRAREKKKEKMLYAAFSFHGLVYVRSTKGADKKLISNLAELSKCLVSSSSDDQTSGTNLQNSDTNLQNSDTNLDEDD